MKRTFALLICVSMIFTVCAFAAAIEPEGHWAKPAIDYAVDKGYLNGVVDGVILADKPMTRAEFVAVLVRVLDLPRFESNPFEDVNAGDWHNWDVSTAYRAGVITGTSETTFSPGALVTREEAVTILQRGWKVSRTSYTKKAFADQADISAWALDSVKMMHESMFIKGDPNNNFNPKSTVTFGEALQIIYNKQYIVSEAFKGLR